MESKLASFKKDTPSETYENLNRLLLGESKENYSTWIEFARVTNTLNSFEKSVKLIVIDSLKYKEGVVEALLSDDKQQICRALSCKWFFEDAVVPEFYIADIFPKVSYSTRCKIINQLSKHIKHEEHAEKLFEYIRCNYSRNHSVVLLPKCRFEFISSYLKDNEVSFNFATWRRLLMKLAPKYPDIVFEMLKKWCDKDSPFNEKLEKCNKLILFMAKRYPNLFIPLFENYYSSLAFLHFGDKLRRSLSPALLDIIFKSERELKRRMFNEGNLFKELDFEGKVNFLAKLISPKKEPSFSSWYLGVDKILPFIKLKSANDRAGLLDAVFKKIFGENLWEHPELWQPPMLELLPLEIREKCVFILTNDQKFANYKYKMTSVDRGVADQLAYLQKCEISIPKLKEMIKRAQSNEDRKIILQEMVESCAINQNLQSLEDVCNYVKNRHRNEDPRTISSFLYRITHSFDTRKFEHFNLSIWTIIEDLLITCFNKKYYPYDNHQTIIEKYVLFRLKNNLDPKEQIQDLIKRSIAIRRETFITIENMRLQETDTLFRAYYDGIIRILDEGNVDQDTIKYLCGLVISTVHKFKSWHKKTEISMKDLTRLIFHLDKFFENLRCYDTENIPFAVFRDEYLKERYRDKIYRKEYESDLMKCMKKNPNYIMENLEDVFHFLIRGNYKKFIQNINLPKKIFDFYNVSERFKNFIAEHFKTAFEDWNGCFTERYHDLLLYSHFANISEYEKLVCAYLPKNQNERFSETNSDEYYDVQKIVPKLIKNINPQYKNFPLIFEFLLAKEEEDDDEDEFDYDDEEEEKESFKLFLGSFDSACYNSPVQVVMSILKEKIDSRPSVKKAVMRNISAICTLQERIKFCSDSWEKEKRHSVRAVIFKQISENFLDKPTDESFNALKKCILESSGKTIKARCKITAIPTRYKNDYVSAIWQYSEKLTDDFHLKYFVQNSVIEEFTLQNINVLSDELCERIIKSGIFNDLKFNNFTIYYLLSNPDSIKRKLDTLLNLMLQRKHNPISIVSFLNVLGRFSLEHPKYFHEVFDLITASWPKIFTKSELFDEFLIVQYYRAYHKSLINEDPKNVLNVTIKFSDELKKIIKGTDDNQEFSAIFRLTIQKFLKKISEANCPLDEMLMIRRLITPPERQLCVIGILLLPNENLEESETEEDSITLDRKKNIGYIVRTLKNFEDDSVQIYYYRRFNLKKFKKE